MPLFYIFMFLAMILAGMILFTRNVLYCAYLLAGSLLCLAALFVFAGSPFVAVTQILVYVGGILVLIIFGVMLTNRIEGRSVLTENRNVFSGVLVGIGMLVLLLKIFMSVNYPLIEITREATISGLGIKLLTDYLLAFEAIAMLLLAAIIGAAVMAKEETKDP